MAVSVTLGVIAAAICAVGLQGSGYDDLINASFKGYSAENGVLDVDKLLSLGGMNSMMWTIGLVIAALMFGGVMERTSQLKVLADKILTLAKSNGSLILTTALTTFGANVVMAEQNMSIVVGARTFAQEYRRRGLSPENLSRVVEDSGTVTANLVPWSSGGAYQTATLGVPTIAYAPFAFFCWLSPLVTIFFGYTGITIKKMSDEELAKVKAEDAEAAQNA